MRDFHDFQGIFIFWADSATPAEYQVIPKEYWWFQGGISPQNAFSQKTGILLILVNSQEDAEFSWNSMNSTKMTEITDLGGVVRGSFA